MKYFRMSYEEVVFRRSYINIMLLNKAIPSFKPHGDGGGADDDDEYTAALKKAKKMQRGKKKEKRTKPPTQHANDFFAQFM